MDEAEEQAAEEPGHRLAEAAAQADQAGAAGQHLLAEAHEQGADPEGQNR